MNRAAYLVLTVATLAVYFVMIVWSLPKIASAAGGAMPFDLRPWGYTPNEAEAFLVALSSEGRAFYTDVQLRLDTLYPPLLALWTCASAARLFRGVLLWGFAVLPLSAWARTWPRTRRWHTCWTGLTAL